MAPVPSSGLGISEVLLRLAAPSLVSTIRVCRGSQKVRGMCVRKCLRVRYEERVRKQKAFGERRREYWG